MSRDVWKILQQTALVAVAVAFGGCSSDSPTAPTPGGTAPGGGSTAVAYTITVTPNPREIVREEGVITPNSQVSFVVRRTADGAAPPAGTTIAVNVDFGTFENGSTNVVLQLIGDTATIVYIAPATGEGTARISAQLQSSVGQSTIAVRDAQLEPFFLTNVDPASGSDEGGYTAYVNGGGFHAPVQVTFAGVSAEILAVESNRVRVRVPASRTAVATGATLAVNVDLVNEVGTPATQNASLSQAFVYVGDGIVNVPVATSITPATAPRDGGTLLTIRGTGFESPVQVTFSGAGTVEVPVVSVSSTQVVVRSPEARLLGNPPSTTGLSVTVRNLSTGLSATLAQAFRFANSIIVTAVSPNQGSYAGGTDVTIFGDGFEAPVQVLFEGVEQTPLSVSGREILVRSRGIQPGGCANVPAAVTVTNLGSGETAAGPSFLYVVPAPLITGINPSSVSGDGGGQQVTISGTGFEAPVRVEINGQAVTVLSSTTTSIVAVVPPLSGGFEEVSCDDNADGTAGMRFVNTAVDITVTNLVTGCEDTFTGGLTYRPTDTSCRGDVAPDGDGGGGPSGDP